MISEHYQADRRRMQHASDEIGSSTQDHFGITSMSGLVPTHPDAHPGDIPAITSVSKPGTRPKSSIAYENSSCQHTSVYPHFEVVRKENALQ